jgi:hypothetical protein
MPSSYFFISSSLISLDFFLKTYVFLLVWFSVLRNFILISSKNNIKWSLAWFGTYLFIPGVLSFYSREIWWKNWRFPGPKQNWSFSKKIEAALSFDYYKQKLRNCLQFISKDFTETCAGSLYKKNKERPICEILCDYLMPTIIQLCWSHSKF